MKQNAMRLIGGASSAALCCAALLMASSAHADILPTVGTPTVTPSGTGTYLWTYDVIVTNTQEVRTGDFFRIYDFAGFVGVNSAPANFSSSVSLTDAPIFIPGLGTVSPTDDPSIENVAFTYTGGSSIVGVTVLGSFVLESTLTTPGVIRPFIGRGTDLVTGIPNGNLTNTIGPAAPPVTDVPEPGAYAFAGILSAGLCGLIMRARRNQRQA